MSTCWTLVSAPATMTSVAVSATALPLWVAPLLTTTGMEPTSQVSHRITDRAGPCASTLVESNAPTCNAGSIQPTLITALHRPPCRRHRHGRYPWCGTQRRPASSEGEPQHRVEAGGAKAAQAARVRGSVGQAYPKTVLPPWQAGPSGEGPAIKSRPSLMRLPMRQAGAWQAHSARVPLLLAGHGLKRQRRLLQHHCRHPVVSTCCLQLAVAGRGRAQAAGAVAHHCDPAQVTFELAAAC